jgi:hypothetical protein
MAIGTGTAILGGAVIGGLMSMKAAGDAADAQRDAANAANATQLKMYNQTREDQSPYRDVGYAALDQLRARMGLTVANPALMNVPNPDASVNASLPANAVKAPETIKRPWTDNALTPADVLMREDPSYQFRLQQGERGINRSAAAGSGLLSGATMKALTRYNQDFASNEFQNSFNRLAALAGVGQSATNAVGAAGQNYANNVSSNQLAAGNARAAGYIGQSNAINNALGMGINAYQYNQLLGQMPGMNPASAAWSPGTTPGLRASPGMLYGD